MNRTGSTPPRNAQGSALILSLIFIAIFAALAAALGTVAGSNVQLSDNYRKADATRCSAESGLEVMRYWLNQVSFSGAVEPSERFNYLANALQSKLDDAGVTNIVPVPSGSTITVTNVPLLSSAGQSFSAVLTKINDNSVRLDVTGCYDIGGCTLSRTVRSKFTFVEQADTVFDFGVASKGPLALSGSVEIEGVNVNVESNAYIESLNALLALSISGSSHIAGNVKIVNPDATVFLGPKAGVGGATGADAMEHIAIGVGASQFPDMAPETFASYATTVLPADRKDVTLTNIRIPAHTNPKFTGKATLRGVLFVEQPNVVEFGGNVDITGVIVTNGSQTDDSGTNQLIFQGNVTSRSVAELPHEAQFEGLHSKTGTFIMAPGFAASFGGSFIAQTGAIAANGIKFFGNAGGTIRGSVINYANNNMELSGNSSLMFNRSGLVEVPAGFRPQIIVSYDPSSYEEI